MKPVKFHQCKKGQQRVQLTPGMLVDFGKHNPTHMSHKRFSKGMVGLVVALWRNRDISYNHNDDYHCCQFLIDGKFYACYAFKGRQNYHYQHIAEWERFNAVYELMEY